MTADIRTAAQRESLYPNPKREARQARRQVRREQRRYRVAYDLLYDGGGGEWTGYYRTRVGARIAAWWNVHVSSYGGTAALMAGLAEGENDG